MVLGGLLMGAREFAIFGLCTIVAQTTLAYIWFAGPRIKKDLQRSSTPVRSCEGSVPLGLGNIPLEPGALPLLEPQLAVPPTTAF